MTPLEQSTVDAVLTHMNGDHAGDNLVIARAFGGPDVETAVMTGLDRQSGYWQIGVAGIFSVLSVAWPAPIETRQDIRRQVVAVYESACSVLGIATDSH